MGAVLAAIGAVLAASVFARAPVRRGPAVVVTAGYALLLVGGLAAAWADPGGWTTWAQEDGPVEWATVAAFVLAAGLYLGRARGAGGLARLGLVVMAVFCVFVAGEEVSWGQRLFGFVPPEMFLADNFQQELNLHNFVKDAKVGGFSVSSGDVVALLALAYAVVPFIGETRRQWYGKVREVFPRRDVAGLFVLVAALEVGYPVPYTGEGAELLFGLAFLAVALDEPGRRAGRGGWALAVVPVGALFAPLWLWWATGGDDEGRARAGVELNQLAADLGKDLAGARRLRKKSSVHKRLFTAVRKGYFRPGTAWTYLEGEGTPAERGASSVRHDARGYFIDPWGTPYWVYWNRRAHRLIVYSCGPNRRRDLELDDVAGADFAPPQKDPAGEGPAGDDIVRVIAPQRASGASQD